MNRVEFEGEVGLDRGGLAKEMFTIAIRDLIRTTGVLAASGNGRIYWFTRVDSSDESNKQARTDSNSPKSLDTTSPEFILGLLAGLAVYNGIYVDLPIPSSIYKLMKNKEVNHVTGNNQCIIH